MHEINDNILHMPDQGTEKLRCSDCNRTLLVRNGGDVMIRPTKPPAPVILFSAGTPVIKCAACGSFQRMTGDGMQPYSA